MASVCQALFSVSYFYQLTSPYGNSLKQPLS